MRGVWLMGFKVSSLTVCQPRLSSLTKLARRPMTHPCCLNFWHQRDQSGACHAPEKPTPARPFRAALGHPRRRAHLFWFWGASPPCFFTLKSRMRGGGGDSHSEDSTPHPPYGDSVTMRRVACLCVLEALHIHAGCHCRIAWPISDAPSGAAWLARRKSRSMSPNAAAAPQQLWKPKRCGSANCSSA